jgi:transposase
MVRSGHSTHKLSQEFEPTAVTIRSWVKQADLDEGRRTDGLTTDERDELVKLRRENKRLRLEREILAKAAAWFAQETDRLPPKDSSS